jgi:hypothetical protein
MGVQVSDILVAAMMNVFGIVGLVLASRALDLEMYVFGLSLAGFSAAFIFGQIRRHFDTLEMAREALRAPTSEAASNV